MLSERGYDLLLYELGGRPQSRTRFFTRHVARKRVDGLLVLSLRMTAPEVEHLQRTGAPTVVVGSPTPGLPSVGIDDEGAARVATRHLLELGHRRIAFVGGPDDDPVSAVPMLRRAGYRAELTLAGIRIEPDLDVDGHFTVEGGRAAGAALLARPDPPTAVVAASDEMAMGALSAARRAGVAVPGGLSVIGIDDHELAEVMDLTTVAQPVLEQGRLAAELLLPLLAGSPGPVPACRELETVLRVRGTTASWRPRSAHPWAH